VPNFKHSVTGANVISIILVCRPNCSYGSGRGGSVSDPCPSLRPQHSKWTSPLNLFHKSAPVVSGHTSLKRFAACWILTPS